jgi:hypothetical protein
MAKPAPRINYPIEQQTTQIKRRMAPAETGLRVLNPQNKGFEDIKQEIDTKQRIPYSAMMAHMELAAQALAVGATVKMAAKYAGVGPRQVKKYLADASFRARVEELRNLLVSKLRGKVLRELDRRTSPELIRQMDLLDVLRIGDRVGMGRGENVAERESGTSNYDAILQQVFVIGEGPKGPDFQLYEPESLPLPGTDSPVE